MKNKAVIPRKVVVTRSVECQLEQILIMIKHDNEDGYLISVQDTYEPAHYSSNLTTEDIDNLILMLEEAKRWEK